MEFNKTNRGFGYIEFEDYYDQSCSMQNSSLASLDCIWFGLNDVQPRILASKIMDGGTGWVKYPIPDDVSITTRMHLTKEQVSELLPYLAYFAKHGTLPDSEEALNNEKPNT